jgi:uncharacterized protein YejL (UPF0352 family)
MNEQTATLSQKIEDLLGVLQRDIEHIERTALWLNDLRGFVIKRDEKGMGRLLADIQADGQEYSINEQCRCQIREELAGLLCCKPKELTLSVLGRSVAEPAKTAIAESQRKLRAMAERLQKEYVSTVSLLSDCSRINSHLLRAIFERSRSGVVCYDSAGQTSRRTEAAFMSARL